MTNMHTHNEIEDLADGKGHRRGRKHDQRSSFAQNPDNNKAFDDVECDETDEREEEIEDVEPEIFKGGWDCVEGFGPSEGCIGGNEAYADEEYECRAEDEL
jgi:hypothetical protein